MSSPQKTPFDLSDLYAARPDNLTPFKMSRETGIDYFDSGEWGWQLFVARCTDCVNALERGLCALSEVA